MIKSVSTSENSDACNLPAGIHRANNVSNTSSNRFKTSVQWNKSDFSSMMGQAVRRSFNLFLNSRNESEEVVVRVSNLFIQSKTTPFWKIKNNHPGPVKECISIRKW